MLYVRQVTTGSGAKAVQVIRYAGRRTVVVRHIGSAHTEREMDVLYSAAYEWIEQKAGQFSMFPDLVKENVLPLDYTEYLGICYTFIYETMHILQQRLGYTGLNAPLLNDLVTIRIMEPASKLRSIELIETYFGIKHRRQSYYESAPNWLGLKQKVEKLTIRFAEQEFCFNYTLTPLYLQIPYK